MPQREYEEFIDLGHEGIDYTNKEGDKVIYYPTLCINDVKGIAENLKAGDELKANVLIRVKRVSESESDSNEEVSESVDLEVRKIAFEKRSGSTVISAESGDDFRKAVEIMIRQKEG